VKLLTLIKKFDLKAIILLTVISVTCVNFNQERWLRKDVIKHDIINYNSYLPALFYQHDLRLGFLFDTVDVDLDKQLYSPNFTPDNRLVIKMSMGMAVTYLPFFGLAHIYAKLFHYPVNGFSEPYHFAILFSTLFYYVIGLIILWRILIRYFRVVVVSLTLFCLTFATNVFFYLTIAGGLAHTIGFTFIAIFIYYAMRWHDNPKAGTAIILGCIGGFLTLVRPVNLLVFIFFFLYNVKSTKDLTEKVKLLRQYFHHLLLIAVCGFLIFLPQLMYWKYTTGHYLFNSYVGEHFFFNNPHVIEGLMGFRKGWLIYTPIMIFSLIGLITLRNRVKEFLLPIMVLLTVYVYVIFSWWCWWYGGSFGARALIDVYPLLAIPFAVFLEYTSLRTILLRRLVYGLITFFTLLNLFQTMQAKYNIIHYDSMTMRSYFKVFFTTSKQPDREKYLDHPDYDKALRGEDIE
jgi:hypothetical protein